MAVEVFRNLAETTLASGYTSGGASITVTSASGFPSTGTFRVRLGNAGKTLYRVDSVSGSVFTGGAEEFDANASAGNTVHLAGTRGAAERWLQSPEAGYPTARSGVSGADRSGPISKLVPLSQSSWTWFNQGSAVVTEGSDLVNLESPTFGSTNIRGRLQGSYPSPPFTLIVLVRPKFQVAGSASNLAALGLTVSDGTKHKVLVTSNFDVNSGNGPGAIWVGKYDTSTTFSTGTSIATLRYADSGIPIWLKLEDNNTNHILSFSLSGVTWTQVLSETRTTHLTPSNIGIVVSTQSSTSNQGGDFLSWAVT
jgi:hypothetical protein